MFLTDILASDVSIPGLSNNTDRCVARLEHNIVDNSSQSQRHRQQNHGTTDGLNKFDTSETTKVLFKSFHKEIKQF